ncbi:MAG: EAL domain-containing protein [Pseudohongiella sp.]|uniref:putative bifunctional diguanylate cyclase/phosphodiesterase n=1 Tax=Pseudohongiella sp. TaxID=1979412 RepID=UPI0034A08229
MPVVLNARLDESGKEIHWTFLGAKQRDKLFQELVQARNLLEEKNRLLEARTVTDDLTGLPNRLSVTQYLTEHLQSAGHRQTQIVVVFIDLDGFKAINDSYGHLVGDQLLKAVGQRLAGGLRTSDLVARFSGDEYIVILEHDTDESKNNETMILRLLQKLRAPFRINGQMLTVSASAGATVYPQVGAVEPEQLIRQADQAMYKSKLAGKDQISWFDPECEANQKTHHELIAQIRTGIKDDQFVLHYQPKVNLITGDVIGAEALIRWQHPDRGLLMPIDFLPHIDSHRVEQELGDWVLASALRQTGIWRQRGLVIPVSVNVSAYYLMSEHFLDRLSALLDQHPDVPSSQLELELLESSAIDDSRNISSIVTVCQRLGIQVALDDFGTGYSTLSHLRDLSVDILKIDRSYVQEMLSSQSNTAIIKGIIGFAKAFDCQVIAEGIETKEQLSELVTLGCHYGQGYYIAKPMPADAVGLWMASRQ